MLLTRNFPNPSAWALKLLATGLVRASVALKFSSASAWIFFHFLDFHVLWTVEPMDTAAAPPMMMRGTGMVGFPPVLVMWDAPSGEAGTFLLLLF